MAFGRALLELGAAKVMIVRYRVLGCCRLFLPVARQRRRMTLTGAACCGLLVLWLLLLMSNLELRDLSSLVQTGSLSLSESAVSAGLPRDCQQNSGRNGSSGRVVCISLGTQAFGTIDYWVQSLQRDRQMGCSTDCRLIADSTQAQALLFHSYDLPSRRRLRHMRHTWPADQFWVFYSLESPVNPVTNQCNRDCKLGFSWVNSAFAFAKEYILPSYLLRKYPDTTEEAGYFNWTITYRRDSTIYAPYGRYARIDDIGSLAINRHVTHAVKSPPFTSKKYLSFIVVSNCQPYNRRQEILAQLSQHMELHIYGKCGDRSFPRSMSIAELSKSYYFYLSFENAFCRDYITEKFFNNGLAGEAVPVVFGGFSKSDYQAVAPPDSFLYAGDFASPQALAKKLKRIAGNPSEYEAFLRWRQTYREVDIGDDWRYNLFCQLCNKLKKAVGTRAPLLDLNRFYNSGAQCRPFDFDPFNAGA